jgi:hypothetical protein
MAISMTIYFFIRKAINSLKDKEVSKYTKVFKIIFFIGAIINIFLILKMGGVFTG